MKQVKLTKQKQQKQQKHGKAKREANSKEEADDKEEDEDDDGDIIIPPCPVFVDKQQESMFQKDLLMMFEKLVINHPQHLKSFETICFKHLPFQQETLLPMRAVV